jgi:hypothetical protein
MRTDVLALEAFETLADPDGGIAEAGALAADPQLVEKRGEPTPGIHRVLVQQLRMDGHCRIQLFPDPLREVLCIHEIPDVELRQSGLKFPLVHLGVPLRH